MQTPKISLWICALMLGGVLTIHAADTSAQATAREALEKKMKELDANPSAMTPAPASAAVVAPAAPAAAPAAVAGTIEVTPAGATVVGASAAAAPAEKTVMKPVNKTAKVKPAQPDAKKQAAEKSKSDKTVAKAKQETPKSVAKAKDSAAKSSPVPSTTLVLSKEERLRWLLARYKVDQISAQEYHTQRAAILAEP